MKSNLAQFLEFLYEYTENNVFTEWIYEFLFEYIVRCKAYSMPNVKRCSTTV